MGTAALTAAVLPGVLVPGPASAEPRPSIATVERRVTELEHEAEIAVERYHQAADAAAAAQKRLGRLRRQIAAREARLAEVRATLGRLASASYRSGGLDPTLTVLLSEDPQSFLAGVSSFDQVAKHQAGVVRAVTRARDALAADRRAAARELRELERIAERRAAEKRTVEQKAAQAVRLLATLRADQRRRLEAAQRAAEARATARAGRSTVRTRGSATVPSVPEPSGSGGAAVAVRTALGQVGDPYVYAADGPDAFDCSGLTSYAWKAAGVSLPRSSSSQYAAGRKVDKSDLQPGDLVYYYSPISHVGMYIGDGKIVHAANPRTDVNIADLDSMPYVGATRP